MAVSCPKFVCFELKNLCLTTLEALTEPSEPSRPRRNSNRSFRRWPRSPPGARDRREKEVSVIVGKLHVLCADVSRSSVNWRGFLLANSLFRDRTDIICGQYDR